MRRPQRLTLGETPFLLLPDGRVEVVRPIELSPMEEGPPVPAGYADLRSFLAASLRRRAVTHRR